MLANLAINRSEALFFTSKTDNQRVFCVAICWTPVASSVVSIS
jgi:hypothetical protein